MNVRITPGSCSMASLCVKSFGKDKMAPSIEGESITIFNIEEDDIDAFIALIRENEQSKGDTHTFEKF